MPLFPDVVRSRLNLPRVPLRVILITAVISQLVGSVGLVGYLSFRNGQKAVSDLASQLRRELTARIEQELQGYFATPHEINRLNADAFANGTLDIIGGTQGESQLYQQMVVAPTVAFVYCGSAHEGEFFGILRSPDDGSLQLSYGNASNQYLRSYYALNVSGDRTFFLNQLDRPFDSRQRPWYRKAIVAQRAIWTDMYIAFTTGLPNITAALPVYDRSERLLGVCATDVVLPEEFRTFLRNLEIGQNGRAFVIDRQGNLISDSTSEPLVQKVGDEAKLLPATKSTAPTVKGTAQYLLDQFGSFRSITHNQQLEFQLGGQRQFLEVLPFRDRHGLDWLIVVVVPESDFMAQINTSTRNTILLCIVTTGLAIIVGVLTSRWITRPILRVSYASDQMAQGDLKQRISPSPVAEINTLANSFNRMAARVQSSFAALRQSESTKRALIEAIPDLLMQVRGDGIYLDKAIGSTRLRRILGDDAPKAGTSVYDSLPPKQAAQRMEAIQKALQTQTLQIYEHQVMVKGQLVDEEVRVIVTGENEVLIMVRDISKRKRTEEALRIAEENYRSIFENALEGIFQTSPEGRYLNVNAALAQIYGYDSPQQMMESITDIAEQIYVDPKKRSELHQLMVAEGKVQGFEYLSRRRDGTIIWTQVDARAMKDSNGNVLYYEGIVQDVSDRKRREDELRRQVEELKIEIDHQKREKEVALITESGYFQELQREISEVNLDKFWDE